MDLSDVLVDEKKIPHTFRQLYVNREGEETLKDNYSDWSTPHLWPDLEARHGTTPMPRKTTAPYQLQLDDNDFPILTKWEDNRIIPATRLAPAVRDFFCIHWCT